MGVMMPIMPKWMLERMAAKNGVLRANHVDSSVLNKLEERCVIFAEDYEKQQSVGLDEESWFRWIALLTNAGFQEQAFEFSRASSKHDERSEQRIQQMKASEESANCGPTRCTTFGCDEKQIQHCCGAIRKNVNGEIINSPASFFSNRSVKRFTQLSAKIMEKVNLLPERYVVQENNLSHFYVDKSGNRDDIPLANFFAWINKNTKKDDGAESQRFYEIEGVILSSGKKLPPILVSATEFENMKWLALWGPEPNILPGPKVRDTVRHAIQSTAKEATEERIFAHLGWVKLDEGWKYLHAGGAVGASNVKVELDPRLKNYVLPDFLGDKTEAMKASLKLLDIAPKRTTLALWGLIFLSPLCEWLRQVHLEPKFLIWLHGYTGSRKTTLSKLYLSHFGNLLEHPPASFKDTINSMEKRTFATKDSLLLIDDYHPTGSPKEAKTMEQLAQQLLRAYGDRIGRGRMRQDTTLRQDFPPRGMAIITAEDVLDGGSSVARLFPVQLGPTDVDLGKLTEAQQQAQKLSQAMAGYLEWLGQAMAEGNDRRLTEVFSEKRNEASRLSVHGRLMEAAAWLYLGLSFGLEYAVSVRAIDPERKEELLSKAWDLFLGTASEQGQQVTEIKNTTRFVNIVAELLANGTIYTRSVQPSVHGEVPKGGVHVGWHDRNYFYFLPEVLYNAVSRFLTQQGTHFPVTNHMLWKQLAEEEIIVTETYKENGKERKHNLRKKVIEGNKLRKLWVKAEFLRGTDEPEARLRNRPEPMPRAFQLDLDPDNGGNTP
ncbi:hypothetical protein [Brevibacillus parabrevis]|jgi:hypothetical protein|uniref:hypothetical protein n=1 Tax=Brevibacillus parabrevis TaxID=54914 RepID=UPI00248F4CCE|nr:hypothetical protein [Brevibacillus parabrevis]